MIELGKKIIHPIAWHMALAVLFRVASTALKLPVVTTFSILGDVVEQVSGDTINVDSMEVVR